MENAPPEHEGTGRGEKGCGWRKSMGLCRKIYGPMEGKDGAPQKKDGLPKNRNIGFENGNSDFENGNIGFFVAFDVGLLGHLMVGKEDESRRKNGDSEGEIEEQEEAREEQEEMKNDENGFNL